MTASRVVPRRQPSADLIDHLERSEIMRQRQLDALPRTSLDVVAAAHRDSVERILEEIRAARRRLYDGTYGTCTGCAELIARERLELRPWADMCTRCTARHRW
ncbi:MAG: TraR/DksA C4-type zinc finger protein [Marmoricola sp.]